MVCMANKLSPRPTTEEHRVRKIEQYLVRLCKQQPHRRRGRQELSASLCNLVKSKTHEKGKRAKARNTVMSSHSRRYAVASVEQRLRYERRALVSSTQKARMFEEQKQIVTQALVLVRQEAVKKAEVGMPLSLQSACWGAFEAETFKVLSESDSFTVSHCLRARDKACVAPDRMSEALANIIDSPLAEEPHAFSHPPWFSQICHRREFFEGVCFKFFFSSGVMSRLWGDCFTLPSRLLTLLQPSLSLASLAPDSI